MNSREGVATPGLVGAGPAIGFAESWPLAIGLFLLAFLVALVVGFVLFQKRPREESPAEEMPVVPQDRVREAPADVERETREVKTVSPAVVQEPTPVPALASEDRVARLQAAFESGRLSREAYEENLRRLGVEPVGAAPSPIPIRADVEAMDEAIAKPAPAPPPARPEERIQRLHRMYREGRLTRDLYERNVRALGGEPVP